MAGPILYTLRGRTMRALAIMYHDVVEGAAYDSSGFPGEGANIYKLRREDFARQLEAIRAAVPAGAVSLIARRREIAGPPPVFLTFDDGGASFHAPIAGMLEQLGWRGHFFITTSRIGTPGFLDATQVRDLARRGHVIGSHSHSHRRARAGAHGKRVAREPRTPGGYPRRTREGGVRARRLLLPHGGPHRR